MKQRELEMKLEAIAQALYAKLPNSYAEIKKPVDSDFIELTIINQDTDNQVLATFDYSSCCIVNEDDAFKREVLDIEKNIKFFFLEKHLLLKKFFTLLCNYECANFLLAKDGLMEVTGFSYVPDAGFLISEDEQYRICSDTEGTFTIESNRIISLVVNYKQLDKE